MSRLATSPAARVAAEPRTLADLPTPAAVVDVDRMRANLDKLAAYVAEQGLALRPHIKTHKIPALAAEQIRRGAVGVTVATAREAVLMGDVASDILLAYPTVSRNRLDVVDALPDGVRLTVSLDSIDAVEALGRAARQAGRHAGVLVELDVGMRRCGVQTPQAMLQIAARAMELDGLEFRGLMFYPGHIREPVSEQDAAIARLNEQVAAHLDALERAGLEAEVVSGGSTPTAYQSHRIPAQTEVRPGTYIFNDRTTAAIRACDWDECAYSILATVVSTAVPGQAVVDAGSKALSREELRGAAGERIDLGRGRSTPASGLGALLERPDVAVKTTSEEHGVLDLSGTDWRPRVGERVRVVPNHVCVSVNLQSVLWAVRREEVVGSWEVAAKGWTVAG